MYPPFKMSPSFSSDSTCVKYKELKDDKQLRRPETVEVGCPRHPGATTIGNQLQDGDRTDGWQNLTTQP